MTDESDTEPEGSDFGRALPQRLNPAGAHRNVFAYQVTEGRDWRDCFRPDFWRADEVMKQLAAGDRIEIFSPDRSIQFEVLILAANAYANPRTLAHRRWLANQAFEHAAQQIVFQDGIDTIEDAIARLRRLEEQLVAIVPSWSMAPVVEAYQAMRGASFLVAVTFAAEIGDVRRFDNPRQLMSFLVLVR